MSCCGSNRLGLSGLNQATVASARAQSVTRPVEFEYVGRSTLRASGPITGRDYWFPRPGARVVVDGRDALSLDRIPTLTRT
jgi:hypothetical protein